MGRILTFHDTSVIRAAYAHEDPAVQRHALRLLGSRRRIPVTSAFVELELVPGARKHRDKDALAFYRNYLKGAEVVGDTAAIVRVTANTLEHYRSGRIGLADALHIAAARVGQCDEIITDEGATKPLRRQGFVTATHLLDAVP